MEEGSMLIPNVHVHIIAQKQPAFLFMVSFIFLVLRMFLNEHLEELENCI
jgi:hypothetical protein